MNIAVASGKGGTGKTTLATALAEAAGGRVQLLDCDVEEPNCHIFVKLPAKTRDQVTVLVPEVVPEKCTACGECSRACRFNAIVSLGAAPMVFSELCHGCGGCLLACPSHALQEAQRVVGYIETSHAGDLTFIQGRLDVGQVLSPPVIRAVRERIDPGELSIIDCPPGTACPMVTAVRGSDYVILVTEPTPFGLHDLRLAVETVREIGIPCGVVVNRSDGSDGLISEYCSAEGITILLRVPNDRRVAEAYSRGDGLLTSLPGLRQELKGLLVRIARFSRRPAEVR